MAAWPLAGPGALPLEPDDPALAIPQGALQSGLRDIAGGKTLAGADPECTARPADPLATAYPRAKERSRKWSAALTVSCLLHATVALAFLAVDPQDIMIAGADEAGIMLLGSSPENQASAGEATPPEPDVTQVTLVTMLDPRPVETVQAQAVPVAEALQPVEDTATTAPATETLEPVRNAAMQPPPPDRVEPADAEPVQAALADPAPEILTARTVAPEPDEPAGAVPVETTQRIEADDEPVVKLAETAPIPEPRVEPRKAEPERQPARKVEKKPKNAKPARKVAKRKAQAGSGGQNQADLRRGAAEGKADGSTAAASRGGKRSSAGNAAVSNYPGKIASRLRRAVRSISSAARRKADNDVQVSFVVGSAGGVGGVRITRSSGSPELDKAALAVVHRAAPFPPIPPEAGRSSWAFTLPLGVAR